MVADKSAICLQCEGQDFCLSVIIAHRAADFQTALRRAAGILCSSTVDKCIWGAYTTVKLNRHQTVDVEIKAGDALTESRGAENPAECSLLCDR